MKSKNTIKLLRRSIENNTHANIVDDSIIEISSWKLDKIKLRKTIFLYLITFGIFFIITRIWKRIFISFTCEESNVNDADYFLILDEMGETFLLPMTRENFILKSSHLLNTNYKMKDFNNLSPFLGSDYLHGKENIVFILRQNKYVYIENGDYFIPIYFEMQRYKNSEIHSKLGLGNDNKISNNKIHPQGIKSIEEYNYLLNKFGKNEIKMEEKSFMWIFLEQLINPFYIYQIYALFIWFANDYLSFGICVILCSSLILLINTSHHYQNYKRILNFNYSAPASILRQFILENEKNEDKISRSNSNKNNIIMLTENREDEENKNSQIKNSSDFIVPGDIIILTNDDTVPCDCVILDGYCTVNESDLTGESTLVMKYSLPNDNRDFNYEANKKAFLFQGTKIMKCESNSNKSQNRCFIYAITTNTGYNTIRGNLIQNILFPKSTNFKFYNDMKIFFFWMLIIWLLTFFPLYFIFYKFYDWSFQELLKRFFDYMTVIIPPIFPICLTFTSFYFHHNLSNKNISCISDKKMNAAGRVGIIVLDKTGTLTEEELDIHGFQTTTTNSSKLEFDNIETEIKVFNKVLKFFWSKFCKSPQIYVISDYQNNASNNMIFFIECLATCHSIDKLKNDYLGNSIDKKIFDKLNWIQEKIEDDKSEVLKYFMIPKNSYKINEKLIFNNKNNLNNFADLKYRLKIVKRFEFSSQFQSMSVIVNNSLDGSFRFFIKGAPEKITQICDPKSLPRNFEEKHLEHTKNGFRVLACATKILPNNDLYEYEENRTKFEFDLTFLGFIIFKNQLKKDTKHIISNLKNSNCKLVLATGDNPFTSLSVARECELIENTGEMVYMIDMDKDHNDEEEKIKIISLKEENIVENIPKKLKKRKITVNKKKSTLKVEISRNTIISNALSDRNLLEKKDSNLLNYEKQLSKTLSKIIKRNSILCVSGKVFDYIIHKIKEENDLNYIPTMNRKLTSEKKFSYAKMLKVIKEKGRIFYRMSPNGKADLINFYKEDKTSIVAMCGDGANDCAALLTADVGISIAQSKGNVAAHFYSEDDSISCIELILKNGRACFENSIIIFKFMVLYAIVQMTSIILLLTVAMDFTSNQYLFMDLFISFISIFLASKTGANYKLVKDNLPTSLLHSKFFVNSIGHILIQVGSQIGFFYFMKSRVIIESSIDELPDDVLVFQSYIWIFTIYQYLSLLFVFNSTSKHRKKFYANKSFIFYFSCITFISICQITSARFRNLWGNVLCRFEDENISGNQINSEIKKVVILIWSILNLAIAYGYEVLINFLFANK